MTAAAAAVLEPLTDAEPLLAELERDEKADRKRTADTIFANARRTRRMALEVVARNRARKLMAAGEFDAAVAVLDECAAKITAIGDEPDAEASHAPDGRWLPTVPAGIRLAKEIGLV